jgi:hypothetical protein
MGSSIAVDFDNDAAARYEILVCPDDVATGDGVVLVASPRACTSFARLFAQLSEGKASHVHLGYTEEESQGPGFRIAVDPSGRSGMGAERVATHREGGPLAASCIGARYAQGTESDVVELSYAAGELRVVVATRSVDGHDLQVQFEFDGPRGFRVLDEGDLIRYWQARIFPPGYHLFEITSGGWRHQETQIPGMLSVSDAIDSREWFVATTNTCINVLSAGPPRVSESGG